MVSGAHLPGACRRPPLAAFHGTRGPGTSRRPHIVERTRRLAWRLVDAPVDSYRSKMTGRHDPELWVECLDDHPRSSRVLSEVGCRPFGLEILLRMQTGVLMKASPFFESIAFSTCRGCAFGHHGRTREPWRVQPHHGVSCTYLIAVSASTRTCIEWAALVPPH
jgi:hypothetical protein